MSQRAICKNVNVMAIILKLEPTLASFAGVLVSSTILVECPPLPLKCLLG